MEVVFTDTRIGIWPLGIAILVALLIISWRRKHNLSYALCLTIFGIYLLTAMDRVFFPIEISGIYADEMREFRQVSSFVNLIPLNFNFSEMPSLVLGQIFQNVLLTVPFGFGVSFVAPIRAKDLRWLVPAVGLGIEAVQLLISLALRYPYRVIDINDVLLNASGVLIGYAIFRVFAWMYLWAAQRFGLTGGGLAGYIHAIARHAHVPSFQEA